MPKKRTQNKGTPQPQNRRKTKPAPAKDTSQPSVEQRLDTVFDNLTEELLATLEKNYNTKKR